MSGNYPRAVVYCGNCGLPPEFCEHGVKFESCKPWLRAHAPHLYPQLVAGAAPAAAAPPAGGAAAADAAAASCGRADVDAAADRIAALTVKDADGGDGAGSDSDGDSSEDGGAPKKKGGHRGGQVQRGGPKKKGSAAGAVIITKKDRGKRKYVTTISGLEHYEHIKLKEVASALGKKFGAGASVTKSAEGKPEVDVQGDLAYDLPDVLAALFGIPEDAIIVRD